MGTYLDCFLSEAESFQRRIGFVFKYILLADHHRDRDT